MTTYLKERLRAAIDLARRMDTMNEFGGLHIIVSDGNIEDEHIEFCQEQTDKPLTVEERLFLVDFEMEPSEIRGLAYFLSSNNAADEMEQLLAEQEGGA